MTKSNYYVYVITPKSGEHTMKKTYVGFTTNPKRRIRQHNREIKGGARYTARYYPWKYACRVRGFKSQRAALQFEWMLKHPTKSLTCRHLFQERRLRLGPLRSVERKLKEVMMILDLFPQLKIRIFTKNIV